MVNPLLMPSLSRSQARQKSAADGFTLMELSIALVIIGLLVGGILVGRDLIRAAQIKNVVEQRDRYATAVNQFRDRFDALPGDFRRATEVWSAASNCNVAEAGKSTCDGNGDGEIGSGHLTAQQAEDKESFRLWQHLVNAELVEGAFNGIDDLPETPIKGARWGVRYLGAVTGNARYFNGQYGHVLGFSLDPHFYTHYASAVGYLTPMELSNLDQKFDDGQPAKGNLVAALGFSTSGLTSVPQACAMRANLSAAATAADLDAVYNIRYDAPMCVFIQRNITGR